MYDSALFIIPCLAIRALHVEIQIDGPVTATQRLQLCENIFANQCYQGVLRGTASSIFQYLYANNLPCGAISGAWRAGRGQDGCAGDNFAAGLGPDDWVFRRSSIGSCPWYRSELDCYQRNDLK